MSNADDDSHVRPDSDDSFPPLSTGDGKRDLAGAPEELGSNIGPYRLVKVLGEGGFGVVYLAEQERPIKRRVALKIIKPGMDTRQVIARFEAERQTLALLDHPNIAHVYDAGTTLRNRPYFVMECVEGQPITQYCDKNRLSIEERLQLFVQLCETIHYAHQRGIIHRDIKPSNVLVSMRGDKAVLKVIDFGVAKAITQPLTERTLFTAQGQLIGTPEYMSPEQAELTNQDIDTRSDVYSLGILLYELLTGILPFDADTLRHAAFDQILRIIREEEPPRPSTRVSGLGEKAQEIAENRQTVALTLARNLRKELEWIPLRAIRKERERRYDSALELARDISNYLEGRPLLAGPDSMWYRLRKLVQPRLRWVAAALVCLMLTLLLPFVMELWMRQLTRKVWLDTNRAKAEAVLLRSHFQLGPSGEVKLPALNEQGMASDPNEPGILWIRFRKEQEKDEFTALNKKQKAWLDEVVADGVRDEAIGLNRIDGVLHSEYVRLFRATEGCMSCHFPQGSAGAFSLNEIVGAAVVQDRGSAGELVRLAFANRIWTFAVGLIGIYTTIILLYWILNVNRP